MLYDLYTQHARLTIDGESVPFSAEFALRWVDEDGKQAGHQLYRNGRRVTKAWTLELRIEQAADDCGGNGNTAD